MNKKITKIKKCKNKVVIYFSKERMDVSFDTFSSFYLYEGKELSSKDIKDIKDNNNVSKLTKYACSLLNKSRYSEWKIREKLYAKDGTKSEVDLVIKNLKKTGLINDKDFANDLYDYLSNKNYGKYKIIQMMSNKGVFKDDINSLSFPYEKEIKKAKNVMPLLKKKYAKYEGEDLKAHIYRALLSKGFDNAIALSMINDIN